jgi:hypothetical protein
MRRKVLDLIKNDLKTKMVFLVGPRQVGKTWLAKQLLTPSSIYLNYDNFDDQRIITQTQWFSDADLVVFDELHKMENWKNYIKGVFDSKPQSQSILVTGSARLDVYKALGDSLAGRYFTHRLFPFTPDEITGEEYEDVTRRLLTRGGFPEPFLASSDDDANRWRLQYSSALVSEDVFTIDAISNLKSFSLVLRLLQERVGSPVSYSSIARDTGISPNTVKKFIGLLEALFVVFRIQPFSKNISRTILKEPKIYFFDTGMVTNNPGMRLENLAALSLYKNCLNYQDQKGKVRELFYLRTKDHQEVDFVVVENDSPVFMTEVKQSKTEIPSSMKYFSDRYGIKAVLLVHQLRNEFQNGNVEVRNLSKWLKSL